MAWNWPWPRAAGNAGVRPERKSASPGGFIAFHTQGEAHWTRRDYATLAREGFMRNPIVHRAVRLISETASAIPWLLYDGVTELDDHPLLVLLERPNQHQAGATFLEALYGHLLLAGNAYVEMIDAGNGLRELHLLRPDRVSVTTDAGGWPAQLDYRAGGATRTVPLGATAEGGAAHLTLFHPLDDHYGFPPLEAALMALDTHNAAGRWNKALLDNSARPSGALVYAPKDGGNLTDEQFDRLKTELEEGYSGATRAGRPLLLEGGLDWKAMGLTPKDMDFIEAKNSASRDIALAFGVPPIRAAREDLERTAGMALIDQSWRLVLDRWPRGGCAVVMPHPVREILSVTVFGTEGEASLIDPADYQVDAISRPARIHFANPVEPLRAMNGIEIDFTAGFGEAGTDVPDLVRRAILVLVAHWYEFRTSFGPADQPVSYPASYERMIEGYRTRRL